MRHGHCLRKTSVGMENLTFFVSYNLFVSIILLLSLSLSLSYISIYCIGIYCLFSIYYVYKFNVRTRKRVRILSYYFITQNIIFKSKRRQNEKNLL